MNSNGTRLIAAVIKFILFLGILFFYGLSTIPLYPLLFIFPHTIRRQLAKILSFYSKLTLSFMGVKLNIIQEFPEQKSLCSLVISNHLSYLDVLLISQIKKISFITSVEVKQTPFLGQICQLAGCFFVERRKRSSLIKEIGQLTHALEMNNNLGLFPESTSSDGTKVLPFKRSLIKSAYQAKVAILPLTINYRKIDGQAINLKIRDLVCWYGEMTFLNHLWKLFKCKRIDVDIKISQPLIPQEDQNLSELTDQLYHIINENYDPFIA